MNNLEKHGEFKKIFSQLKQEGMGAALYKKISEEFEIFLQLPKPYILELLSFYVNFNGQSIYVNEIRNYLKENSKELFQAYGKNFRKSKGCLEVFGIPEEDLEIPDFKIESNEEEIEETVKEYNDNKAKRRKDRTVKRNAKKISAEKFKQNLEKRREKDANNREIDRLIRKQDL